MLCQVLYLRTLPLSHRPRLEKDLSKDSSDDNTESLANGEVEDDDDTDSDDDEEDEFDEKAKKDKVRLSFLLVLLW